MFAAHNLTYILLGRTADSHTLHIMGCNGDNTWDKTLLMNAITTYITTNTSTSTTVIPTG